MIVLGISNSELTEFDVPQETLENLIRLDLSVESYIDVNAESTQYMDAAIILFSRVRITGVAAANRLMKKAADGLIEKRSPIDVAPLGNADGRFVAIDGNSTLFNLKYFGFKRIPVIVRLRD